MQKTARPRARVASPRELRPPSHYEANTCPSCGPPAALLRPPCSIVHQTIRGPRPCAGPPAAPHDGARGGRRGPEGAAPLKLALMNICGRVDAGAWPWFRRRGHPRRPQHWWLWALSRAAPGAGRFARLAAATCSVAGGSRATPHLPRPFGWPRKPLRFSICRSAAGHWNSYAAGRRQDRPVPEGGGEALCVTAAWRLALAPPR